MRIGLIADTHSYLGDDVLAALAGCDHVVHAGDIGAGVLASLARLAPVTAVRGNNDTTGADSELPEHAFIEAAGMRLAVVHRLADAPPPGEWDILVFGHCHKRHCDERDGRLLLNPGAAGRRGFHRTRSVAVLELAPGSPPAAHIVDLGARKHAR